MLVLGIETSCDDTAVALIRFSRAGDFKLLAEKISSQDRIHAAYGGVVPELAAREHLRALPLLVDALFAECGLRIKDIDLIGVTRGPGLKGSLLMGFNFAKGLGLSHALPIVGVNHIEGHLLSPFLENPDLEFPYLCLVVSGGHTEIVQVEGFGRYSLVARTVDDAAGEAFDKSANLLGFSYPGGARLAALADTVERSDFKLPRVMREAPGFSFSGLKTAISLLVAEYKEELESDAEKKAMLAYAIQESIIDALCYKLKKAISETGIKNVCVTGGVSANKALRKAITELDGVNVSFPSFRHSTDNGAMIAFAAKYRFDQGERLEAGADVLARWPVEKVGERE